MKQIEYNTEKTRLFKYYKQLFEESKKNKNVEKSLLIIDHLNLL